MNLSGLKEKLQRLDATLPRRRTLLAPGEAFFTRQVELPEGIAPADVPGFVQLQLEASAPFPLENLAWGFVRGKGRVVLVFAGVPDRVYGAASAESLWHVFPSFLPLLLCPAPSDECIVIGVSGGTASALFHKAGGDLPQRVSSSPLPSDFDPSAPQAAQKLAALLSLPANARIQPGIRRAGEADSGDTRISFPVSGCGTDKPFEAALSGDALWNADVRGRTYAASERKVRRTGLLAWNAFSAGCVFAGVLLVAALALVSVRIATGIVNAGIRSRAVEVEALQDKADFATNLESVTERDMKPFSMLAVANSGRPEGVIFEKVSSLDWNVLHVEGVAQRSEFVQSYIELLSKNPSVRSVKTNRTATTGGHATFDIDISFNALEDLTSE